MFKYRIIIFVLLSWILQQSTLIAQVAIHVGADQLSNYSQKLKNKRIGLVVNPSSMLSNGTHLVDVLIEQGLNVSKIFSPEHGFRGTADAGAKVKNGKDPKTGLSVYSLHGKHRKPTIAMMQGLDVMVFDIQDVGVRFYTYISTMHYVMESCAENGTQMIILDRPNPNGHYIDGPVMEDKHKSFLGMHSIPIVHGLTVGELALMINGEKWLKNGISCNLDVIPVIGWSHQTPYSLPIKPSPNLPNDLSINLYPSLCFFEQTIMSIGRGTDLPFQVYGHPDYEGSYVFTPHSKIGASSPKLAGQLCKGKNLENVSRLKTIDLSHLINAYQFFSKTSKRFFLDHLAALAGTNNLQEQIETGWSETAIKNTWKSDLDKYREIRKKYLLYN